MTGLEKFLVGVVVFNCVMAFVLVKGKSSDGLFDFQSFCSASPVIMAVEDNHDDG